ncbi:phosphatase PAP2 family protein [Vogesella sp. LIG4]|uniref:phosphatase PAP2 family protein n=1 Tax=Vogesella sp. LIG4 TaxID=1192162 RepID=UPI00081F939F|nr:phosphatase PAP2 family protein [Vogesella sp. LIG4]SCK15774.1 undecaprenyl-diphosphatase [Vogesella sp. LIG4]
MSLEALNIAVFKSIAAQAGTAPWHISLARLAAADLIYFLPLMLVVMWLWGNERTRNTALRALAVTVLALLGNLLMGSLWYHPRPFAIGLAPNWINHAADSSFPSDHMTVCCAIAFSWLASGWRWLGRSSLVLALLVALGRIYLGVHYPLDMLGAALMAAAANLVVARLWPQLGGSLQHTLQGVYQRLFALPISRGWCRR